MTQKKQDDILYISIFFLTFEFCYIYIVLFPKKVFGIIIYYIKFYQITLFTQSHIKVFIKVLTRLNTIKLLSLSVLALSRNEYLYHLRVYVWFYLYTRPNIQNWYTMHPPPPPFYLHTTPHTILISGIYNSIKILHT